MDIVRGNLNHYNTLSALFGFVIKVVIVVVIFVHWDYIQFRIYLRYVQVLRLVEDIANHFSANEIEYPNGNTGEDSPFTITIYFHD